MVVTAAPLTTKSKLSTPSCNETLPVSVCTNCGRKARNNMADLGLRAPQSPPCLNASLAVMHLSAGSSKEPKNSFYPKVDQVSRPHILHDGRNAKYRQGRVQEITGAIPRLVATPERIP